DSERDDQVRLRVGAGFDWDQLVLETVRAGWRGIECLSGIPGQVGAAPVQNIGAYGQSLSDRCLAVEVYALDTKRRYWLDAADCDFAYRDSLFKRSPGRFLILSLELALEAGPPHPPRHPQLQSALAEGADAEAPEEALLRVREAVLALRRSKGMTLDVPSCPDRRSAGSFFMNPVVSVAIADAAARQARAAGRNGEMPRWPEPDGRVKLSAAWLIEAAGFPRGYQRGAVGLSTKHTLALTNRGGGRSAELISLAQEIQAGVAARLGVTLSPEPVRLGFSADPFGHAPRLAPAPSGA
ncbi:MAG: UDP-N-acetylmuramate dehydrogenase, partial [Myxococcota bacterium]|nr:UDP-N-acetylmuramate dehydrogenase [Myxococcota bacterium]